MGNRSRGKNTGKGHKNSRPKKQSSGMKQRGKGAKNKYRPTSRKGYGGNSRSSSNRGGSGK